MQHWINHAKRRYYSVMIMQDMFGGWQLIRAWGDLDSKRGNTKFEYHEDEDAALDALNDIQKRRESRGYVSLSVPGDARCD